MAPPVVVPLATLPGPPAGPLGRWKKILWYVVDTVAHGSDWLQFNYGMQVRPISMTDPNAVSDEWRRIQVHVNSDISTGAADDQIFTLDVVNYTNNAVDNSWTSADYTTVDTKLAAFCATIAPEVADYLTFDQFRYYAMRFNPYTEPKPFPDSGGPVHTFTVNTPGTGLGAIPPQNACTVTELTPSRTHWGRFYLPTLSSASIGAGGRLGPTKVDGFAGAAQALYEGLMDADFFPVVPTTQSTSNQVTVPTRTLQGVTGIQVDDVTDIIRRRRWRSSTYKAVRPVA